MPEATIRSLISLHHAAASFMHSPEEARIGFENAFKNTPEPTFATYERWRDGVLAAAEAGEQLVPRDNPLELSSLMDDLETKYPMQKYWQTWKEHDTLFESRDSSDNMSERERQVKEALFGTWERGGLGMGGSKPGLEGVLEYLGAKGTSVAVTAKEWEERFAEDEVEAPKKKSKSKKNKQATQGGVQTQES